MSVTRKDSIFHDFEKVVSEKLGQMNMFFENKIKEIDCKVKKVAVEFLGKINQRVSKTPQEEDLKAPEWKIVDGPERKPRGWKTLPVATKE